MKPIPPLALGMVMAAAKTFRDGAMPVVNGLSFDISRTTSLRTRMTWP